MVIYFFQQTDFDWLIYIAVILLVIEWWRSCCYFKTIRGELALFYDTNELYWARQRWSIIEKPILMRYAVIIRLRSKRNNKKCTLFMMNDSVNYQDWRSLHYFLRQYIWVNR